MDQESVMETATTAGAGVAVTSPLWITTLNPYIQFTVAALGAVWLCVQIYYKIRNENRDRRSKS
jgi:hypothetical protein